MSEVIQGLWIGSTLSVMERLSISSFLRHGHAYHLYVYEDVDRVPVGAVVRNAEDVLPSSMIFRYTSHRSYAGFANFFRYKLLLEQGGWWVDTDTVCVQPFRFDQEYVFSSERDAGRDVPNNGLHKVPPGSEFMRRAWEACRRCDPGTLQWGELGPKLIRRLLRELALERYVQPPATFCPIAFTQWRAVIDPAWEWKCDESTYAIHLWNEMWRREGQDKDATYPRACLYERLKREYLGG